MHLSLTTLDKKIRGIRAAERELETAVDEATTEHDALKRAIIEGQSTGDALQDWAVVRHGTNYKQYARLAHAVQDYLAGKAGQLVAVLNRRLHSIGLGEEILSVGVLSADTLAVRYTPDESHIVVLLDHARLLYEQREGELHDAHHYLSESTIGEAESDTLVLTTPKHLFDGLHLHPSVGYFVYSGKGSSLEGSKLIAGDAVVTQFLRDDFWKADHTTSFSYTGADMSKMPGGSRFYTKVPPPEARPFFERAGISL